MMVINPALVFTTPINHAPLRHMDRRLCVWSIILVYSFDLQVFVYSLWSEVLGMGYELQFLHFMSIQHGIGCINSTIIVDISQLLL